MGVIAPIDLEKGLIVPIDFRFKHWLEGNLLQLLEVPNGLLGILDPSIQIPNDAPDMINII